MILAKEIRVRDPYIFVENDKYYLIASKGYEEHPFAILCYESNDLENFKEPLVLFEENNEFWSNQDFWAPELHKFKGKYYLFVSFKSENKRRGVNILVSETLTGKYVPLLKDRAITPLDWECLDGTLFVENDIPYMIFCHEWVQVKDGEMCIAQLSDDLSHFVSEPKLLFHATDAKWVVSNTPNADFITDGPFIKKFNNKLVMLWSSLGKDGYAMGVAISDKIMGPWKQIDEPIYRYDGGHGMIFKKDDNDMVVIHCPNNPWGSERMKFFKFEWRDEWKQ